MAAAIQQLNVRLQQPGTMATILPEERDDLASQDQSATSTITQKLPGVVDTRVIGRPDEFDGDPMKYTDWLSKLRAYSGAVPAGFEDDKNIVNTETRREDQLRGELPQHTEVLHTRDGNDRIGIGQVSQCRHEQGIRGQETVRDGMGNGVCWTPDERAIDKVGSVRKTRAQESIIGNCWR